MKKTTQKFLATALALTMVFALGSVAFADGGEIGIINTKYLETVESNVTVLKNTVDENSGNIGEINDNQGHVIDNEGGIIDTNNGEVDHNCSTDLLGGYDGQIDTNNGTVGTNDQKCTVSNNNAVVTENIGTVFNNSGKVDINKVGGTVVFNDSTGTVESNFGTVRTNGGTISFNGTDAMVVCNAGTVKGNNGVVQTNYGTVYNPAYSVDGAMVIDNHSTVMNGAIVVNEYGYTNIVPGKDTIHALNYNDGDQWTLSCNVVEGKAVLLTAEEAELNGCVRSGYLVGSWTDVSDDTEYEAGSEIDVTRPFIFVPVWVEKIIRTANYNLFNTDSKGNWEGKSFTFDQPMKNFQNVSFNGAYLEKDVDYKVSEADGGTKIEFTAKFFEKNGDGPLMVAPLFIGAVFTLSVVNK